MVATTTTYTVNPTFNVTTQSIEGVALGTVYDPVTTATPEYPGQVIAVGTRANASGGAQYVFATANAVINAWDTVWIDANFNNVLPVTQALSLTSGWFGFAQMGTGTSVTTGTALTTGQSGWFMLSGTPIVNISGTLTKDVPLYVSGTAGQLTITTQSASGGMVQGVTMITSTAYTGITSAAAVVATSPIIRRPGA